MSFQLDFRPQDLDSFFGNEATKASIQSYLNKENRHHTVLLTGPSGCGKTTLARIIAKELGCHENDLSQLNISNTRGIDAAREIIDKLPFSSLYGDIRVIILNECQMAEKTFQNTMLEVLEEPPNHIYFILCTTDPDKLIKAWKTGRASTFHVLPLNRPEMYNLINWVCKSEGKIISQKTKEALAHAVEGCPREALAILDTIIDLPSEELQIQAIATTKVNEITLSDIFKTIIAKRPGAERWGTLSILLRGIDQEPEQARRYILVALSNILLNQKGDEAKRMALLIAEFMDDYYSSGKAGLIKSCFMSTLIG